MSIQKKANRRMRTVKRKNCLLFHAFCEMEEKQPKCYIKEIIFGRRLLRRWTPEEMILNF